MNKNGAIFPCLKCHTNILNIFRMDPFAANPGFSLLNIFKKTKTHSVENSIAVIGVKKALLIGEFIQFEK